MPKKRGNKNITNQDFTINDSANAPKPVGRVKKSTATATEPVQELPWDQLLEDDVDLVEVVDPEGVKRIVSRKKRNHSKPTNNHIVDNTPGVVYPEIVWYHISRFIDPDDVGRFGGINKVCYAITRSESFWRFLYKVHCQGFCWLPRVLRLENNSKLYGLRQRVIRALYLTYYPFLKIVLKQLKTTDVHPHNLVKRRCVNVWFQKFAAYFIVYFKLKKVSLIHHAAEASTSLLEELERIDANPEDGTKVLLVQCKTLYDVPPLMGMTLCSVNLTLSTSCMSQRLQLGFTSAHNVTRHIIPECSIILENIINIQVFDWWHPKYPYYDNSLPIDRFEEESLPVLKKDFFS